MKLKSDKFRKARGGYSRLLKISCSSCGAKLFNYQKDGPGIIKRLYVDRIFTEINDKNLKCPKCGHLIATIGIYEKENRIVYNVSPGAIKKRIVKITGK